MKRTLPATAAVCTIALLASCARPRIATVTAAPPPAEASASAAVLEGTWREIRNQDRPVTGKTWTFERNAVRIRDGELAYTGTFVADPSRTPGEIDFVFDGYPRNEGILLVTADLLTLKVRDTAVERAKAFGVEPGYTLILCERVKESSPR